MAVPDFTDRFNTQLTTVQEGKFRTWVTAHGRTQDLRDYDLRGAWLQGAQQASNGHFTDKFKKPNHPTFSDESIYSGQQGYSGGQWSQNAGKWSFTPGATNLQYWSSAALQHYFKAVEPDSTLRVASPTVQAAAMGATAGSFAPNLGVH